MFKTEFKYGIITGCLICLWILVEFLSGFHTDRIHIGRYTIYFVAIIPLITIYLGLKKKRDLRSDRRLPLTGGIKSGLMISLIAAVIISIFLTVYFSYINPQYSDFGVAYYKEKLISSGKTSAQVTDELNEIKGTFSFINQLLFRVIGTIGTGLLISFFVSLYLNRDGIFRKNMLP